ncbi:MAG TPA: glycosyl hydrolase family 28-related protein, partial [Stellaceae bacterium]|nr:glycosyl hydrolase family 28-related protein [Stellaceae bacterium]
MRLRPALCCAVAGLLCCSPAAAQQVSGGPPVIGPIGAGTVTPAGGNTASSVASLFGRTLNVLDFGAKCDGATDDGPAFQAAVNAAPTGGTVFVPPSALGCYLNTTVTLGKALTISGAGDESELFVPNTTAFSITSPHVRFTRLLVMGNRSASSSNKLFDVPQGAGWLKLDHMRIEQLNTIGTVEGGCCYDFSYLWMRNIVQSGFILDQYNGTNGNDAYFDHNLYDTDVGSPQNYAQPNPALIWVKDFDAIDIGRANDFIHAGQTAGIEVNPQGTAIVDRLFIDNTWFSTDGRGVYFTGANDIIDPQIRGAKFHHNTCDGVSWDNTSASANPTTLLIRGATFAGNNNGGTTCNDINFNPGNHGYINILGNTFGNYFLWTGIPSNNILIGSHTTGAPIQNNDFSRSNALAKINGLTTVAFVTQRNRGFTTEAGGRDLSRLERQRQRSRMACRVSLRRMTS